MAEIKTSGKKRLATKAGRPVGPKAKPKTKARLNKSPECDMTGTWGAEGNAGSGGSGGGGAK